MQLDPDKRKAIQDALIVEAEWKSRQAQKDGLFWLTNCTQTMDEQDPKNPYKPFPKKPYFGPIWDLLSDPEEHVINGYKSRTMMGSWLFMGWCAHRAFTNPATRIIVQSEDEDRSLNDIKMVKILWDRSDDLLKKKWPLKKELDRQVYNKFELANDSSFLAMVGNPDKIRSEHPTVVVLDEAAYMERGEEAYNVAAATRCLKILCLSSANEGWYEDWFQKSKPADWPLRREKVA